MQYDFVPMPDRKPLKWPNGARIAVMLCLNLEYWDLVKDTDEPYYPGGPSILPDPLPGNIADLPNYSWREYGQRVGIWRLFALFGGLANPHGRLDIIRSRNDQSLRPREGFIESIHTVTPAIVPFSEIHKRFVGHMLDVPRSGLE